MIIRLWGKAPNTSFFVPASTAVDSTEYPEEFGRILDMVEHGWIVCIEGFDPNRCTAEQLENMAIEIVELSKKDGITSFLVRSTDVYVDRLKVDWHSIGYINAPKERKTREPKPPKTVGTDKIEKFEQLKANLESVEKTGIPPAVKGMFEKYNGNNTKIPVVLVKSLEKYYEISQDTSGNNLLTEKES